MRKVDSYYLVARDRLTNDFEIVSLHGVRDLTLEEIDSYTTHFKDESVLEKGLNKVHKISLQGVDFFIVHKSNKKIQKYEVLYEDNVRIRKIAEDFLSGNTENSMDKIDSILDGFARDMTRDPLLYERVVTGRTGIYSKYVNYFIHNRCKPSTIKYREGGWGRHSYPLIRNIVEAKSRKSYDYSLLCDKMYRDLLDEDLLREADPKFNPEQLTLFDEVDAYDERLLNVLDTFINLPAATVLTDDKHAYFNKSTFDNYRDGDLEKLQELLPEELLLRIRLLLVQRDCMDNAFLPYSDKYYRPIEKGQKSIVKLFMNHPEMLDRAEIWCNVYHSYEEKVLGDAYGREYKKRK